MNQAEQINVAPSKPLFKRFSQININNEKNFKEELEKKVTMKFNVGELISFILCSCCPMVKSKSNLFRRGYRNFNNQLNILTYMRKMHEIDMMILDDN
jgi:hypothetical protein